MTLEITSFESRDALMRATAKRLAQALKAAIQERGLGCAALSGGSTPGPAYSALAAMALDWENITLALVDERFVSPTHEASNQRLVRGAFAPALDAGAVMLPMYAQTPSVRDAADLANAQYANLEIDIALMGMGADGHTASWFPGADRLQEALDLASSRTVLALHAAQAEGSPERLTLTRAALARVKRVLLLITGKGKRARLEQALAGDWAPVTALFDAGMPPPQVLWAA